MSEDERERNVRCLEIALDNRKLEIQLLWQRTLVFWGFIAALFIAVVSVMDKAPRLSVVLAITAALFSLIWTLVNRASKSWQDSWEEKTKLFFNRIYGEEDILTRRPSDEREIVWILRSRKLSVSRLLMTASDFVLVVWIVLSLYLAVRGSLQPWFSHFKECGVLLFAAFALLYAAYVIIACRSRTEASTQGG